jgi:RNA polymerase sigma factor (sigma-70 family)
MRHIRRLVGVQDRLEQSDNVLVKQFAECGDQAAFEALVRRHGPMVLGVCRRVLRNDADADDAFQATFLVLARKAGAVRKGNSIGSWLHGIALRVSLRARVAAARRAEREQHAPARSPDPLRAGLQELAAALDDELSRLPARYRDPLVLCYLEGHSRPQAAHQLGCSLRTLMRSLDRGRKILRHRLERRDITLSAVLGAVALAGNVAPVSAALQSAAVGNALLAIGTATAGSIPGHVSALADGLATAMSTKVKISVAAVLVTLGALVVGVGLGGREAAPPPPQAEKDASNPPGLMVAKVLPPAKQEDDLALPRPSDFRTLTGADSLRHGAPMSSLAFFPGGDFLASSSEGKEGCIRIWDTKTGKGLSSIEVSGSIFTLAASRAGNLLAAAGEDRLIRVWNARTGKGLRLLSGHKAAVSSLVFSPDGRTLISADFEGMIRQWNMESGETVGTFAVPRHAIHALALSPDGKTLAAGCEQIGGLRYHPVHMWDLRTRAQTSIEKAHVGYVWTVAFAPDGQTLASSGGDGLVNLWGASSGKPVRELSWAPSFPSPVRVLAFSPTEKTLVAGSVMATVHVWDLTTGRTLRRGVLHPGPSPTVVRPFRPFGGGVAVAFSDDGKLMATAGGDGRIRLWNGSRGKERFAAALKK